VNAGTPRISVLMAAFDAEATIRESVESVLAQSLEELELIVIDDGSRAPVAEVLGDVRDRRLRVVRHPRRRGVSAARNTGLREARGAFIAQLDADDLWESEYAATVLARFDDPAVGLVYTNAWLLGHPAGQDAYILDPSVHPMDRFPKFAEQNPVPSPTATMRAEAVRAAGGWATWLRAAMDYHLYAKLIMAGWRFAYIDRRLASYRWPEPSRGMSWNWRRIELEELKLWLVFVARHPRVRGPRRQVRMRLRRELARATRRLRGK
jgi:glycosyltransferase involved in cell wall biosynthesis